MSRSIEVNYTGEGPVDALMARRIILAAGHLPGKDHVATRRAKGKAALDISLRGLNAGVRYGNPVLALRDLDRDAPCAAGLVASLIDEHLAVQRQPALFLRVAVRSADAWLLADHAGFARASGVPLAKLPADPEGLERPKDHLRALLCRYGNRNTLRLLRLRHREERPTDQVLAGWTAAFAAEHWDVLRAAHSGRAPSLARCLSRLQQLRESD